MRLLKLKIKNIASLKGEHVINFAEIQNQSPLFAITGETGSGKSTILNCLGLSLYGQIFKKNVNQVDVVTLGEKEGQIELIFQVKGKNYLAFWKARVRKQNGELYSTPQSPTRDLYLLEGEEFDSAKNISTLKVDDILNLDFDQFCKCIILNQGEFAKFLMSSFSERKDILEKLYSGEMLESLSRELKLELDSLQKQKNDLDVELGTLKGDGLKGEDLLSEKERLSLDLKFHDSWQKSVESMDSHFVTLSSYHTKFEENKRKVESTKQEMANQTRIRNESLLRAESAQDQLNLANKSQEKERPRLEELLKSEETLLQLSDQTSVVQKKNAQLFLHAQEIQTNLSMLIKRETTLSSQRTSIEEKMRLPFKELKAHQKSLDQLFDLFHEQTILEESLKAKSVRLQELEISGKEKANSLKLIQDKLDQLSPDLKKELEALDLQKKELLTQIENKQRAEIKSQELKTLLTELENETGKLESKKTTLMISKEKLETEILPIETTLSLSELMNAVTVCRTHPSVAKSGSCPVCESSVNDAQWKKLQSNISSTDLVKQKERLSDLTRDLIKNQEEFKFVETQIKITHDNLTQKKCDLKNLAPHINLKLPAMADLDRDFSKKEKELWESEALRIELKKLEQELAKARDAFGSIRLEVTQKTQEFDTKKIEIKNLSSSLGSLTPGELNREIISRLKAELKLMLEVEATQTELSKVLHEKEVLSRDEAKTKLEHSVILSDEQTLKKRTDYLSAHLQKELQGKKASALLMEMTSTLKTLSEEWVKRNQALKNHDLALTDISSRLRSIEELSKDYELHYIKAMSSLKEASQVKLPPLRESLSLLVSTLNSLTLELQSPSELFVPLKELLLHEKDDLKELTLNTRKNLAQVLARLEDWEKRQDKISLLELKRNDLLSDLDRLERLYEVLGKDELRTFVLSLVEENLIEQTNDELQKLCQGRYKIVHGSRRKITPEFYVLDKYREGGLRKVSTLSGGETFMVSLAMALALAEMTRGQAEIDTLFIDEGFGTLDQDSLEDVLEMLNQIQNRGLMVGIISHIKPLTEALPVNLVLHKKQDGNSSLTVRYN